MAVFGAWLAVMAGAQPATTLDAGMQRDYAQAGRVGGSVGVAKPENRLQVKDGVAAYATGDSLFIQPLRMACTLPICGWVCAAQPVRTLAFDLSLDIDTIPPLGLLDVQYPGDGSFAVVLALALPGDRVQRIELQVGSDGLVRYLTGNPLALAGQPGIRAFVDLPATGNLADAFLALGLKGALRRIEMGPSGGLTEVALVAGTTDDFLSQGEGWIGTAQGRIWRFRSGYEAPYLEAVQVPSPGQAIGRIDAYIAHIAPDRYLLNRGTHWTGPQPAVAGLVGASPRWKTGSTWVELWLGNGSRSLEFGQADETVRYRRDGGAWLPDSIPPPRYQGEGRWVFEISLRDPDRNLRGLRIAFGSYDVARPGTLQGVAADPEVGCIATGWCLPGDESVLTLTLGPDSMTVSLPILEGRRETDPTCNTPVFMGERKTLTRSERWRNGDWIEIGKAGAVVGSDRYLFFSHGSTLGMRPGNAPRTSAAPARSGAGMRLTWEAKSGAAVDAGGRLARERAGAGARHPARR